MPRNMHLVISQKETNVQIDVLTDPLQTDLENWKSLVDEKFKPDI